MIVLDTVPNDGALSLDRLPLLGRSSRASDAAVMDSLLAGLVDPWDSIIEFVPFPVVKVGVVGALLFWK